MIDLTKLSGVYFTVEEAASFAGMTRGRMSQMLNSGEAKGLRITGKCWLVAEAEAARVRDQRSSCGRPRVKMAG